jgi:hypothetical protein
MWLIRKKVKLVYLLKSQISVSAKEEEESINTKESISDKKEKMIMEENISVQSEDVSNEFNEEAEIETAKNDESLSEKEMLTDDSKVNTQYTRMCNQ